VFADQIRRTVMAAPRVELPKVSALLWKAYAAGQVTEAEASELSARIPQMDRFPGDLWALFIKAIQRLAQQEAGSFCFHPLHPPRLRFPVSVSC
jgi:hypothetical protein